MASVALVHTDQMLLVREKRGKASKLSLLGGKARPGETFAETAAREAYEETGGTLAARTREAIAAIPVWTACAVAHQHVGVLRLDDATLDFDRAAANGNPRSKTVIEGLEWHPIAHVRTAAWRQEHMHFHANHLARVACASL